MAEQSSSSIGNHMDLSAIWGELRAGQVIAPGEASAIYFMWLNTQLICTDKTLWLCAISQAHTVTYIPLLYCCYVN